MRKAVEQVRPLPYSLLGDKKKGIPQYNCQDYADALRSKYNELIKDKKIPLDYCKRRLSVGYWDGEPLVSAPKHVKSEPFVCKPADFSGAARR